MNKKCQIDSVKTMNTGKAELPPLTIEQRLRIFARRYISPRVKKRIRMMIARLLASLNKFSHPLTMPVSASIPVPPVLPCTSTHTVATASMPSVRVTSTEAPLQVGDLVRVRDREIIESTLNESRQYKGCAFMGEMWQYCGTVQRVMKRVQRFVDERDARVYKTSGIVLLENMICQGTADYGPCDRSCFYFWREEWLEKIEPEQKNMLGGS